VTAKTKADADLGAAGFAFDAFQPETEKIAADLDFDVASVVMAGLTHFDAEVANIVADADLDVMAAGSVVAEKHGFH
jgi:hypothetical protein